MAHVIATVEIPASPSEVWDLIGGFGSLPEWLPAIQSSEVSKGGRVRTLAVAESSVVEELVSFDAATRSYSYRILESAFPVSDYLATLGVSEAAGGSRVDWTASFTPQGADEATAVQLIQGVFDGGLAVLAGRYETIA